MGTVDVLWLALVILCLLFGIGGMWSQTRRRG